jgi:hypothetical protein
MEPLKALSSLILHFPFPGSPASMMTNVPDGLMGWTAQQFCGHIMD